MEDLRSGEVSTCNVEVAVERNNEWPKHQCTQCPRSYKRVEHLQRHIQAHSDQRPYQCELCRADFQRSDVLNRHRKTCNGKRRRVSAAKRVCAACARGKRACDMQWPCSACVRKKVVCVPVDAAGDQAGETLNCLDELIPQATMLGTDNFFTSNMPNYGDVLAQPLLVSEFSDVFCFGDDIHAPFQASDLQAPEETMLGFLERFTSRSGLVESFDCGTAESRVQCYTTFVSKGLHSQDVLILAPKSEEIVALVQEVITVRPRNSAVALTWCNEVQSMCQHFFSPLRLRLYLDLYFAIWAPNVSFLHRPTFRAEGSKAVLVAAMAIIGATVSPDETDNVGAKMWFSCVEEMVFQDDDFCNDQESQVLPSPARVQSLQAAYMVCLFQNWNGNDAGKRRIRRFRFNTLISVARDFGLDHARHLPLYPLEIFSWEEFFLREQLIRTLLWIFLLDTAFVIFHNSPPRVAIMEMKLQLGCNEAAFQAATREECHRFLLEQSSDGILLHSTTGSLCRGPMDGQMQDTLADLGTFNLFVLTSALHSIIFQIQQSFGYEIHMAPINNALDNWAAIWQLYTIRHANTMRHNPLQLCILPAPEQMWQRVGFSRFAAEYWLLAKLIVQRIKQVAQKRREEMMPLESSKFSVEEAADNEPDPSKLKYDETSMRQVNEMISHFQKVVIK